MREIYTIIYSIGLIQDALWIDEATEEDVSNVFKDVYRIYNLPTVSKKFLPTFKRISE